MFTSLGTNLDEEQSPAYFYIHGNKMDRRDDFAKDNKLCVETDEKTHLVDAPLVPKRFFTKAWSFDIKAYTLLDKLQTADEAYADVLAKSGCVVRDSIERRIIRECRDGEATFGGSWNNHGIYGIIDDPTDAEMSKNEDGTISCRVALPSESRPNGWDTDGDGMPDEWEKGNGFDPSDPSDGNHINPEGYTALEKYLCSLMGENINGQFGNATSIRTEHAVAFNLTINGGILTVRSDADVRSLQVFDDMGRCRLAAKLDIGENRIDISSLPKGVYIVWVADLKGYRNAAKISIRGI